MESLIHLYKIGRGPSSSHTMGPIAALETFISKCPDANYYEITLYGSLALTGEGHLTNVALLDVLNEHNLNGDIVFNYDLFGLTHPNTLKITAFDEDKMEITSSTYFSIGGGNIIEDGIELNPLDDDVYPFENFEHIKQYCRDRKLSLVDVVNKFEGEYINEYLSLIYQTMKQSIERGLNTSGHLPGRLQLQRKAATLYNAPKCKESSLETKRRLIFACAYAVAEENASGGEVVTAPTCGSAGILPAVLLHEQLSNSFSDEQIVDALKVAGLIGVTVKQNGSISGAEAGCQAECGVACAMAAAALAYLNDLSLDEIEYAAEVALEHHLGLTCDPVGGYVQIPCIERNAVCATRAFDAVLIARHLTSNRRVSLDDIIATMYATGQDMNPHYRETSLGGMAKVIKV